jgi:hypothetical protein
MSRPRKIYGLLFGSEVGWTNVPEVRASRVKIVGLVKDRAWDLAAHTVPPGHA